MKVLLTSTSFQDTPGKHQELLAQQNFDIDYLRGPITEAELLPIIANYDAVICGDDEYTSDVLDAGVAGKLKFISKYGVGLDKIDLNHAKQLGIPVTNCPGVNQVSVAEHVMALLLTFEKNVHLQFNTTKEGSWKRLIGNEIFNKTIGIVGLGAVGKELAKRASAFGMYVIAYDLNPDSEFLDQNPTVKFVRNIDEIFADADFISLHVPHTPSTEYLINESVINDKIKKNVILINTARGKLVDIGALKEGLSSGKIRGYLTDVLEIEPIAENEPLKGLDNVIITPHVGSRTYQSVERQGSMAVQNLLNMINSGDIVAK